MVSEITTNDYYSSLVDLVNNLDEATNQTELIRILDVKTNIF